MVPKPKISPAKGPLPWVTASHEPRHSVGRCDGHCQAADAHESGANAGVPSLAKRTPPVELVGRLFFVEDEEPSRTVSHSPP